MGQQNGSEVCSVKLNGFIYKTTFCLTSLLCKVSPSKYFFKPVLGLVWRRPNRFCKMFAPVLLQNGARHAWQKLSGKIVASRRVPKKPPPTKCQSHICCNLTSVFFWKELWTGILWTWAELVIGQKKTGIKIGYTWIGTKKKWNKNMAKKIVTTIDRETDLKFTI